MFNHFPRPHATAFQGSSHGVRFGEFYAYQGWLSPGVRLFQRIGFLPKALWVLVAFMLPLTMLLAFVGMGAHEQIAFARSERAGLTYVNPLLDLVHAAQARRMAAISQAPDLADSQQKVAAAFEQVRIRHGELGSTFGVEKTFHDLQQAHQALMQKPTAATPDDAFAAHTDFIEKALHLVRDVARGSQLVLDPESDTFYMMEVAVMRGPQQYENMARMMGLGHLVLKSQALPASRHDNLVQWASLADFMEEGVESAYQTSIGHDPELEKQFDMVGTDQSAVAFLEALNQQVLGQALNGDASQLLQMGNLAVSKQITLAQKVTRRLDDFLQARISRITSQLAWQLAVVVCSLGLAVYLMLAFYRVMMGGLQEVSGHLNGISSGNLTTNPAPWGNDEMAQLMVSLAAMQASLRKVVSTVLESSSQVQSSSTEIAEATLDLSRRTEKAASSLQETAASTEQISATVKQTAETVSGAMDIVRSNAAAATRGGEVITDVVQTMQKIRVSSNKIGEIISVIDSIAFQTNILALNAAVEAARAGEQGRGFAVVASEVRALASRSSSAAKEIKSLITDSIHQVEVGSKVVSEAGTTIQDIVANADKITSLMDEIATATKEQSNGVGLVGTAVSTLDQSTQQNAALVEQTAAATNILTNQAQRLAHEVGYFRLDAAA